MAFVWKRSAGPSAVALVIFGTLLSSVGRASAEDEINPPRHPTYQRGNSTITVLGGVAGLALSAGLAGLSYAALDDGCPDRNTEPSDESFELCIAPNLAGMFVSILAAPFLTVGGVAIAGGATGGTGGYGWSLIGGLLGLVPGFFLIGVSSGTPAVIGTGIALLPVGLLVGAVLGYRSSADLVVRPSIAINSDDTGLRFALDGTF